jgi:hypothetical protein
MYNKIIVLSLVGSYDLSELVGMLYRMLTPDWTDKLDKLIWEAIVAGKVSGQIEGKPDEVIESGLAHIFFYGDTVYKLYKTHADKDHFIKGVLAPTNRRTQFMEHDFELNSHFSSSVYLDRHSLDYLDGVVVIRPYDGESIYKLIEMNRLDFDNNLHEQLLRGEVSHDDLFVLGHETAKAVDTCSIRPPDTVNWYDLAHGRVSLLRQFVDWLPEEFGQPVKESMVIEALVVHLEKHKEEYLSLSGEKLVVNLDNHDENVFLIDGKPQFIDLLPPMGSWWYGLPHANLSNLMANVEVLHSKEAALKLKDGYLDYHEGLEIPEHSFGFTHAFAYLISIAHFGSAEGKGDVARGYMKRLEDIPSWL